MNMNIKICGLSTPEAVAAARDGGATHLGFIFFAKSPRNVPIEQAAKLMADTGSLTTVAVTVNADDVLLDEIASSMKPAVLQLHGNETPDRVSQVKEKYGLPVIKALAISSAEDIDRAGAYDNVADILLLDAKPPKGSDLPGGNGVSFDWELLNGLKTETPVLLSGGLDINNAGEARSLVTRGDNSIVGLDVSSGVESAPGVKDIGKIKAFLAVCRG